jgi:hypothetical protein
MKNQIPTVAFASVSHTSKTTQKNSMASAPPLGYIKFSSSQQKGSLKMFSLDDSLQGHLKEGDR